jgi:hypothetical protein
MTGARFTYAVRQEGCFIRFGCTRYVKRGRKGQCDWVGWPSALTRARGRYARPG